MAKTQEALMRKVEEPSELIVAKSLNTQSEVLDAQSTQVAEQAVKLAAIQGERDHARTREHRSRSSASDIRQGSCSVSVSRQNVPKFLREAPQYPVWWANILSHLSMCNCREAGAPRADPILVGDEHVRPATSTMLHVLGPCWSKR